MDPDLFSATPDQKLCFQEDNIESELIYCMRNETTTYNSEHKFGMCQELHDLEGEERELPSCLIQGVN